MPTFLHMSPRSCVLILAILFRQLFLGDFVSTIKVRLKFMIICHYIARYFLMLGVSFAILYSLIDELSRTWHIISIRAV